MIEKLKIFENDNQVGRKIKCLYHLIMVTNNNTAVHKGYVAVVYRKR